jgi:hypothetical protein
MSTARRDPPLNGVEINITEEQVAQIYALRATMPDQIHKSFTKGKSTIFGCAGEIIVSHYFGGELRQNKDYDMVLNYGEMKRTPFCTIINSAMNMNGGQARCEIKTKKTTVAPKEDYANSIARFSAHQDCDLYIFVRVLEDMTKAWITGVVSSPMFYKNATFHQRGEKDRSNNFTFHADCWNMSIKESLQLC